MAVSPHVISVVRLLVLGKRRLCEVKMNQRKTIWTLAGVTVFLFFFAISVFLLSVYFGEQTKDPDAYEFLGWFAMLGIMLIAAVFGCATLGVWLSRRNKTVKLFGDSQL